MQPHHRAAIDALVADVQRDGTFQAVILSGSLAKGTAKATSDLDVYLVVSEDEYADRRARHELTHLAACDYPDGYVDGKIISLRLLEATAERGTEPMRSSFTGAVVVHSTIGDLQPLIDRIPVYPEANRAENQRDFFAALALQATYFGPQALERDDPFLLSHSLTNTVLFAGRLVLARNRILFPCPKQLLTTVASAPDQPEDFGGRTAELLRSPTVQRFHDYLQLVGSFGDWGIPSEHVLTRFMELDEWWWFEHGPALAQR